MIVRVFWPWWKSWLTSVWKRIDCYCLIYFGIRPLLVIFIISWFFRRKWIPNATYHASIILRSLLILNIRFLLFIVLYSMTVRLTSLILFRSCLKPLKHCFVRAIWTRRTSLFMRFILLLLINFKCQITYPSPRLSPHRPAFRVFSCLHLWLVFWS